MLNKNIVLLGVTGFTGSLISELLLLNEINFIPAGRDLAQLNKIYKNTGIIPVHVDINSEESTELLLQKTDILINCIGPFNLYGNVILKNVAKKNIIYIDISGEQEYIYKSFSNLNQTAKQNKSTIIHSVSFESYIADMLSDLLIEKETNYKDISSFYYFENGRVSSGTRLSMKLNRFFKSFALKNKQLLVFKPFEFSKKIKFDVDTDITNASFMPYPEVFFFEKKYKTKNAASYLIISSFAINIFKNNKKSNNESIDDILNKERKRKRVFMDKKERRLQEYHVLVNSIDTNGEQKNICVKGNDGYGLTANLVVEYLKSILKLDKIPFGVFSPAEIIDSKLMMKNIQEKTNLEIVDVDFKIVEE